MRLPIAFSKPRLEALADGIFAIAMTLLVLEVAVEPGLDGGDLRHALRELWPSYVSYGLSFLVLAVYWVAHQAQLGWIARVDRAFTWISIVFLGCVAFVPFSASLLGEYRDEPTAVMFYGGNLLLVGVALFALWWYATRIGNLTDGVTPMIDHLVIGRIITAPLLYVAAMALSAVSTNLSVVIFFVVPVLYVTPGAVELIWERIPLGHHHD